MNTKMKPVEDAQDKPMQGYLVIHVAGYKRNMDHMMHVLSSENGPIMIPDRFMEAELHPVGSMLWCEEGWAVGDNPRERFCKWNWVKSMRKFHDFDEAVTYVYRLRQKRKRPHEKYTLVYFLKNHRGNEVFQPVSSMDDIERFEREVEAEANQYKLEIESRRKSMEEEYPEIELLRETFSSTKAFQLSQLLKTIRRDGKNKAIQDIPKSTYYRGIADLRKLGLVD